VRRIRVRILILHSRYLSGQTSGENRVVEDEARLLATAGHEVRTWTPTPSDVQRFGAARLGTRAIWSRHAVKEVRRLVRDQRSEIVHCHNLFPLLSPAVISAASAEGAAVVMTLHNYRLLCLPATFLRDGRTCEDCLARLPWRGVIHGCYRDSRLGSGVLASSLALHGAVRTFAHVRLYLAVGQFVRDKYVQAGFPEERVAVKPNFVAAAPRREGPGDYFLFLGRLSREKGLGTLLTVWTRSRKLRKRLVVAGDGPERALLRNAAPTVDCRGTLPAAEIPSLLSRARALLLPSLSFEGAPRVVLEAYASGVPVLASRLGGLPELIEDGGSGMLVCPRDLAAWAAAVERLTDDAEAERMGERAWRLWRERYSPDRGLANMEAAYRASLQKSRAVWVD
jgi:glycosyltransferase involved in cell wall biosynthesis